MSRSMVLIGFTTPSDSIAGVLDDMATPSMYKACADHILADQVRVETKMHSE